jgi:hypothetical protein
MSVQRNPTDQRKQSVSSDSITQQAGPGDSMSMIIVMTNPVDSPEP